MWNSQTQKKAESHDYVMVQMVLRFVCGNDVVMAELDNVRRSLGRGRGGGRSDVQG